MTTSHDLMNINQRLVRTLQFFLTFNIYVVNYVKFKGPFGSINLDIERLFKARNVPNGG